jgi:tetratricopeptide (TPR) repeat protein
LAGPPWISGTRCGDQRGKLCGSRWPRWSFALICGLWCALAGLQNAWGQTRAESLKRSAAAYREGQAALARHDLAAAETAFEEVVRLDPKAEPGHAALGTVLLEQRSFREGIRELEAARAINRNDMTVATNLALAYQEVGSTEQAIALFRSLEQGQRAQKQRLPAFALASYARALAATGRLTEAESELEAAIRAEPRVAEWHEELGSVLAQEKDWVRAQQEFTSVIALDPKLAVAHLRLGLVLQAQGKPGALGELQKAGQMAPNDAATQLELGKALAAAGHDEQAIPVLEHVLELKPETVEASELLGESLQRSGHVAEAMERFETVLAAQPDNATTLTNLGMAYAQMQRAKDAVPILQKAVALAPENVTAHQNLAAAYVQLSQFGDAAAELRTALKLDPDSPQLHYNLGLALKSEDDAAGAIPELERAEKLDAAAPEAPYLLGVLYMQAGRYAEASRELQISLKLRPQNGDGWATLGSVYSKLNQLPEAAAALAEAIRQLPEQPDPHLTLAAVLTRQGKPAEATAERRLAAGLMRIRMNRQRAEVATNSGKALLKGGDLVGAKVQFEDALGFDAGYAEAHRGLASVLEAQGKTAEAAAERQKAETAGKPGGP